MAPSLKTMRILWGAMLGTVGLLAILLLAGIKGEGEGASRPPMFVFMFIAVSVVSTAMSFFLPMTAYKQAAMRADLEIVNEPVPDGFSAGFRQAAPTQKVFADTQRAERAAAFAYTTPFVLSLALSESVGMMGFVLGFMGFEPLVWAPFMAASFALIAIRYPTRQKIAHAFERARGALFAPTS